jgi:hypothetical protein
MPAVGSPTKAWAWKIARADFQKALSFSADVDASLARPAQELARQRLAMLDAAKQARKQREDEEALNENKRKQAEADKEDKRKQAEAEGARRLAAAEEARTKAEAENAQIKAKADELRKQLEAAEARKKPEMPIIPFGRRVALVIGNTAYRNVATLPNAVADAEAVAATLRQTGFEVVSLEGDLTRESMIRALRKFEEQVSSADWAVIYYSGHGIEIGGVDYLIPVDARLASDRDVEDEAVSLTRVMDATEGARRLRLFMLDACRDNPFVPKIRRTYASRSIGRGLARIEPDTGTLVVYSARDGQIALDGDSTHSPFTTALLRNISKPDIEIAKMFRIIRDEVLADTKRRQEPFVYGSLPGEDFFFVTGR